MQKHDGFSSVTNIVFVGCLSDAIGRDWIYESRALELLILPERIEAHSSVGEKIQQDGGEQPNRMSQKKVWCSERANGREGLRYRPRCSRKYRQGRYVGGDPIVVVLTEAVSDAHLAGLRGADDLGLPLELINRELDVKRLLLEGRGAASGAFPRAGIVDELNLVLCPALTAQRVRRLR